MEISLNWLAIIIITLVTFFGGAFWHGPLFGKIWMKIHHGDKKYSEDEMKKMMEGMWKLMTAEFVASLFMIMTLAFLIVMLPVFSGIHLAFLVWIGFVVPTMTSVVLWGNDAKKYMLTKIVISSSFRLVSLLIAGYILSVWK